MDLKTKYAKLLSYAQSSNVGSLTVSEQNNVLYVNGSANSSVKDRMWAIYNEIDPDMRAADLVMNIEVTPGGEEIYVVKSGDNLSKIASHYPAGVTWQKILEANKDTLKDPDKIFPGQKLRIPL